VVVEERDDFASVCRNRLPQLLLREDLSQAADDVAHPAAENLRQLLLQPSVFRLDCSRSGRWPRSRGSDGACACGTGDQALKAWRHVTFGWTSATSSATSGARQRPDRGTIQGGKTLVQQKLTEILRGRWATSSAACDKSSRSSSCGSRCGRRSRKSSRSSTTTGAGCSTIRTWRGACPSGQASWSRLRFLGQTPDGGEGKRWSLAGAEGHAGVCARSRRATTMISVITGGSVPSGASSPLCAQAKIQAHATIETCRVTQLKTSRSKAFVTSPEGHGGAINAGLSPMQSRGRPHDRRRNLLGTRLGHTREPFARLSGGGKATPSRERVLPGHWETRFYRLCRQLSKPRVSVRLV